MKKGEPCMPKGVKESFTKKTFFVDLQKVKELQQLLKAETESQAIRAAIDESVTNHQLTRSLTRFLDALAKEQA
jgi:hypothetical protein